MIIKLMNHNSQRFYQTIKLNNVHYELPFHVPTLNLKDAQWLVVLQNQTLCSVKHLLLAVQAATTDTCGGCTLQC